MHGIILLVAAMLLPNVLNLIPLASLAAILLMVGYKLAKPALFKSMYKEGWEQFFPFVITIAGIVLTDLLTGIGIGLVVAVMYILWTNYKKPYLLHPDSSSDDGVIRMQLAEEVTFLHKAGLLRTLNQIPENTQVQIDMSRTVRMHRDVEEIIDDFRESAQYRNIDLDILGTRPEARRINSVKDFESLVKEMDTQSLESKNGNGQNGRVSANSTVR